MLVSPSLTQLIFLAGIVLAYAGSHSRDYVEILSKSDTSRKGDILQSVVKASKTLDGYLLGRIVKKNKLRGAPCGAVLLDGTNPTLDATTAANALIGNAGVSVVAGTPVISTYPGYGMIAVWESNHALSSQFPNG